MFQNWNSTNVLKAIVPATVGVPASAAAPGAHSSTASVPSAITAADVPMAVHRGRVRIFSSFGRGRRLIASESPRSTPSAIAGGPSMMMFTHRIAMAVNGCPSDTPSAAVSRNSSAKPSVVLSWKRTNLTMLP